MTLARGALVFSFIAAVTRTSGAEPCAPRAMLAGEAVAVDDVASELRRLGVATDGGQPECSTVEAHVARDAGGIAVAIVDRAHRREDRVVSDPALAAAWIDSWVRDDLDQSTWETHRPEPLPRVAAPTPESELGTIAATASRRAAPAALDRIRIAAGYEEGWSDDGSAWTGASVTACARIAFACVGVRGRYARQIAVPVLESAMTRTDRSVLATASVPLSVGRMTVTPEAGLGVGQVTTDRVETCQEMIPNPAMCDPTDPTTNCMEPQPPCKLDGGAGTYVGDKLHATSLSPRAAASLAVSLPLFDHVWLEGLASIVATPLGHSAPYRTSLEAASLPGEPGFAFQLGLGLRVGAR